MQNVMRMVQTSISACSALSTQACALMANVSAWLVSSIAQLRTSVQAVIRHAPPVAIRIRAWPASLATSKEPLGFVSVQQELSTTRPPSLVDLVTALVKHALKLTDAWLVKLEVLRALHCV